MQPAAILSRKDIARLQKAIDRLVAIGASLNGQVAEIAPPRRRRTRTTTAVGDNATNTVTTE